MALSNKFRGSGTSRFRSAHGIEALRREVEEGFDLGEYLERGPARGAAQQPPARFDPNDAYGVRAEFGKPTNEDTRTWGNTTFIPSPPSTFITAHDTSYEIQTTQLIHVSRRRPTSFNILTVLTLGAIGSGNWAGENPVTFTIQYIVGVGQTQVAFNRVITIATPSDGLQIINTDQYPLNSLQTACNLSGVANIDGAKFAAITQMCAPVFE